MAEGGYYIDGSEPVFEHECTHLAHACRQEAVKSCKECRNLLCQDCLIHHERNMKAHTLVYIESLSKSQIQKVGKIPTMLKCLNHPDRDIEMYCGSHDMVYCSLCVAKDHRYCKGVNEIQNATHKANLTTLQKLVADLTRVNQRIQETKLAQKNRVKDLMSMKASILREIKSLRKRMNDHLDVLEDKLIAEFNAEQRSLEDEAKADVKEAERIITVIEQQKPDMTANYGQTQIFIVAQLAQFALYDADKFLIRTASTKRQTLVFEHNVELLNAIEEKDRIGKLTRHTIFLKETRPSSYAIKSVNSITIRYRPFLYLVSRRPFCITDMCQLSGGTILVIDNLNNILKRLGDDDKIEDFYTFSARPRGICPVSSTEVAVLLDDKRINILQVGRTPSCRLEIKLPKQDQTMNGLAHCSDQFWVLGNNSINIYTHSAKLVKTIERDTNGDKIFKNHIPCGIAVNYDDSMVFVTAGDTRVVVFNKYGDFQREFRDGRLDGTRDICITCDDIVLVLGTKSVIMFDLAGECLGKLISFDDPIYRQRSLCFDKNMCRLLVSVVRSDGLSVGKEICMYYLDKLH